MSVQLLRDPKLAEAIARAENRLSRLVPGGQSRLATQLVHELIALAGHSTLDRLTELQEKHWGDFRTTPIHQLRLELDDLLVEARRP